jgi:hypothetical protein
MCDTPDIDVQLYVHISDVLPTEPAIMPLPEKFNDPDEAKLAENNMDTIPTWIDDIKVNGIKYALSIDGRGTIRDGNGRYWTARELGIEYLPISFRFLTRRKGLYPKEPVKKLAPEIKATIKYAVERYIKQDKEKRKQL